MQGEAVLSGFLTKLTVSEYASLVTIRLRQAGPRGALVESTLATRAAAALSAATCPGPRFRAVLHVRTQARGLFAGLWLLWPLLCAADRCAVPLQGSPCHAVPLPCHALPHS